MQLTVMTWNVENLFRPGTDAGPDSDAVYQDKLTTLAQTTTELGPDILALQEIGSADSFQDLQQALGTPTLTPSSRRAPTVAASASAFSPDASSLTPSRSWTSPPTSRSRCKTSAACPSRACAGVRCGCGPRSMA